jgi:hypothetical protein
MEDSVAVQLARYSAVFRRRSGRRRGRSLDVGCFLEVPCNPSLSFLAGSYTVDGRRGTQMDFPDGETCLDMVGTETEP